MFLFQFHFEPETAVFEKLKIKTEFTAYLVANVPQMIIVIQNESNFPGNGIKSAYQCVPGIKRSHMKDFHQFLITFL